MQKNLTPFQQIRNLLIVMGSGIGAALLLSIFLVSHYGPTGSYAIKDLLLAPEMLSSLHYNDSNPKTGGVSRYIFSGIEFYRGDKSRTISLEKYRQFYTLISSDKSLLNPSEKVLSQFIPAVSALSINVRTESNAAWQEESRSFQQLQFGKDYYRAELHEEKNSDPWAYYSHQGISQIINDLFEKP